MEKVEIVVDKELYGIAKYLLENYPKSLIKQDLFDGFGLLQADGSYVENFDDQSDEDIAYLNECMADECNKVFSYDILKTCGCGSPEETYKDMKDLLNIQYEYIEKSITYEAKEKRLAELGKWGLIQFVFYVLDEAGILNHGSSIGGAWLTDLGEKYLYVLNKLKAD